MWINYFLEWVTMCHGVRLLDFVSLLCVPSLSYSTSSSSFLRAIWFRFGSTKLYFGDLNVGQLASWCR
uniref:Uncharacterized protein n=1 Tax=virus sp. ctDJ83 TaxID=2827625 RepID=A0A8S5RK07_9VIRU|nr:MAG TPA: hypothetical protein [virus sp. ctDJ83]